MTTLPVRYHLEIYEDSFINDPCVAHETTTPMMAFNIGDLFDPRSITTGYPDCPADHWWRIESIVHRVWEIEGSHVGHQIGLCVVPVPAPYAAE